MDSIPFLQGLDAATSRLRTKDKVPSPLFTSSLQIQAAYQVQAGMMTQLCMLQRRRGPDCAPS